MAPRFCVQRLGTAVAAEVRAPSQVEQVGRGGSVGSLPRLAPNRVVNSEMKDIDVQSQATPHLVRNIARFAMIGDRAAFAGNLAFTVTELLVVLGLISILLALLLPAIVSA